MIKHSLKTAFLILSFVFIATSCEKAVSSSTGWDYNSTDNGGFEKGIYFEQETGPGLIFIEGGTFTMGQTEDDIMYEWNNPPRQVTVSSFYIDESEVSNINYREYLYWLRRVYVSYPEVVKKAMPDTLVWRGQLGDLEDYVQYYLRHPAYQDYPVVGVSWIQANDYCSWRTNRVNEMILVREGILNFNPTDQQDADNFDTEAYLAAQYDGDVRSPLPDLNPNSGGERGVKLEDGILLPRYRLPTEAEWEYSALANIGSAEGENVKNKRLYPWEGNHMREFYKKKNTGEFVANFTRAKGDKMGVAGALNDGADITTYVKAYWPNDYGLYNMAGNVNEWVADVYRKMSFDDVDEFRPYRGNVFMKNKVDAEGLIVEKDHLGRIVKTPIEEVDAVDRLNYQKADNINYKDGEFASSIYYSDQSGKYKKAGTSSMYYQGKESGPNKGAGMSSLVTDRSRVYKGGSWEDRAYWLAAGTRRFLDERIGKRDLGFRCAMSRIGAPTTY